MKRNAKSVLRGIAVSILYIYILTLMFAAPYFNWRYAREHGFGKWLLLGQIIPTARSVVWPYYAAKAVANRGSAEDRTDPHFANSRRATYEALKIMDRYDGVEQLPAKEAANLVSVLQAAVTEAELVDDAYLLQVHPEFARRWRAEYTGSLRDLTDGVRTGDGAKMISAAARYNSFSEWVSTHSKEIHFP